MGAREQWVCYECVRDRHLADEIRTDGEVRECTCCQRDDLQCWEIEALAARVKEVFDANYELTPSEPEPWEQAMLRDKESSYEWTRDGESPGDIVQELTGLSEEVCVDIVDCWDSGRGYRSYKDVDYEDPYGSDACYVMSRASHHEIEERWRELQEELSHKSRFFSRTPGAFLDDLFEDVQTLQGYDGPIIETHTPAEFPGIFRGRTAFDEDDVRSIVEGLPDQLGALRGRRVSAGRMNAAGVTVMYGALEEDTCVAEVRAPVGSMVVIGKFKLLRPIRVLNLMRLERCYADISLFDPNAQKLSDRMAFLRSLSRRLSVPVFNHNAPLDYLVTQCIAEYIAALEPRIDGVAFASAQAGGDAMNLVLFDEACHVAPLDQPAGTVSELETYFEDDKDMQASRTLVFRAPEAAAGQSDAAPLLDDDEFALPLPQIKRRSRTLEPTLQLDLESIRVHLVKRVTYDSEPRRVSVHQEIGAPNEDFGAADF